MKHLIFTFCLILSLMLTASNADAQSRHSIAFRYTLYNYTYPLSTPGFKIDDIYRVVDGHGVEIAYYNKLSPHFYLSVPLKLGEVNLLNESTKYYRKQALGNADLLLQYQFTKTGNLINPYLLAGVGSGYNFDSKTFNANFPVGIGVDIRLLDGIYLTLQSEHRFTSAQDGWQHGAGLHFFFGEAPKVEMPADRDGDGITDAMDACPDQPGPSSTQGCPDTDGDGIADKDDACPSEKGLPALNGCPDRDGDGIADKDDACPTEKGLAIFNGCPDTDNDGIVDKDDKCPREAGPNSTGGCPDRDGDGVADKDDACPDKPGEAMHKGCPDTDKDGVYDDVDRCVDQPGTVANHGCPEMKKEEREMVQLAIRQVQFETGKSVLLPKSLPVLDNIAEILKKYPYYSLTISGYTDNVGDEAKNLKLSKDRAKSCFDYLVSKGVAASRLSSEGYGEANPVADNKTAAGRAQNRRTEFDLKLNN